MMAIKTTKGDLLDVMSLQEQIDHIVFDYMDTSVRHEIAHEQLNELFTEVQQYFASYIMKNNGVLPDASTYWLMFVSCVSQLSYFLSITTFTTAQQSADKTQAVQYAELAVATLPQMKNEDDELLVDEMNEKYTALIEDETKMREVVASLATARNDVATSLRLFAHYVTQHTVTS
ncbi:hypothetical protein BN1050_00356 [Metalysinibacillus saudimassiliensis]|uniref:Uncharacterized protein n=1 Tax=Metalysinibacillus saudimassiliensis TaxID=1461583 RepID=A0A078M3P2_9BACL|nr:hypothetical protein BN1050_00356 [Metalysinibacillus saudimassiliensis]